MERERVPIDSGNGHEAPPGGEYTCHGVSPRLCTEVGNGGVCVCVYKYIYIYRSAGSARRATRCNAAKTERSAERGSGNERKENAKKKKKKEKKTQPGLHNNRPKVNERRTDTTLTRVHLSPFDT